jgi:hypothetical protein
VGLFDLDHPFFLPVWRRVAVVAVCALWSAVEWATASPFWGILAGGLAVYAYWGLFLKFDEAKARARAEEDRRR